MCLTTIFLDRLPKVLAIAVLTFAGVVRQHARAARGPNVVLIVTDDQGYGDIGAHGNEAIETPHMDRLHAQSVRLTNFHVDPTCSPTRAALLTGRYSTRTGVWHTIQGRSMLNPAETTLAEALQQAGYATGMFGKWHLGDAFPCRPQDQGFDEVLTFGDGALTGINDYFGNDYFDDHYLHNGRWKSYTGYCTDVWFNEAMKWIGKHKQGPFFCYIPTNAPHWPYWVDEKYSKPYADAGCETSHAAFWGMITNIDENLGRLLSYLDQQGLAENTIVVFMSDNGSSASYMDNRPWKTYTFNAGMRAYKGSAYDGGHRVPFFIRWPAGGIGGDEQSAEPRARTLFVHSQRVERPQKWREAAVMTRRYRLVHRTELYDITSDPGQQEDIAARRPDVVARLQQGYERWWADVTGELVDVAYVIGDDRANPTILTTHDLHSDKPGHDGAPWHQNNIRRGSLSAGFFIIDVAKAGRYRFTLRGWPSEHPQPTGASRATVRVGRARAEVDCDPQDQTAVIELNLPAARHARMEAELHLPDGRHGTALFVEIERLGST